MKCTHPNHVDGQSCEDHAVGCHKDCRCCCPIYFIDWNGLIRPDYVGMTVRKKSGKPFKSGNKTAIVSGLIERDVPSGTLSGSTPDNIIRKMLTKPFFTFSSEEKGYAVVAEQCEEIPKNSP